MSDFLQVIESLRAEDASRERLFNGEGRSMRLTPRNPRYAALLTEAAALVADVYKGRKRAHVLTEAMTTSDFPLLFGDILDRQLLANYREMPAVWQAFAKRGTVRDFRTVSRHTVDGAEGQLSIVPEQNPYVARALTEGRYQYAVKKYGAKIPFSWEAMVNDGDLDALKDSPARLARAARRTEAKFASNLYLDTSGPDATFFSDANANIVNVTNGAASANPVLSTAALQQALIVLARQRDTDSEPIVIEMVNLIVPPALEITARNILNALTIEVTEAGGTSNQKLIAENWMKGKLNLVVDPYIPIIATTNGSTSWFLMADPRVGRPAMEVGFLRGNEEPALFMKSPNATRVGGGGVDPMAGDFDTDSLEYKVRHILGGVLCDPKMAVSSNGSAA